MNIENEMKHDEMEQVEKEQSNYDLEDENVDIESEEAFETSEALEQKKCEANSFNVEGNQAQNQIFIQDVGSGGFTVNYYTQKMMPIIPKLPVEKRYDLCKTEECIEFVETFKNSDYLTTALLLSVFEAVALTDLQDLKSKLLTYLPEETIYNTDGQEVCVSKEGPFTALNSILAVIEGKKFVTEQGQQCVSIGENSIQALTNILEQFPALQETVAKFLVKLSGESRYHTMFYESQMATLFVGVHTRNMLDLENHVLSYLYPDAQNTYLLGRFVYNLYLQNEEEAKRFLQHWLCGDRTWLWKPACLTYMFLEEMGILFPFEKELRRVLIKKITCYRRNDFKFIAVILMNSKHFRTMVCGVFSYIYKNAQTKDKCRTLAQTYLYMVRYNYYEVNSTRMELPLVVCDTKQQQEYLTDVLGEVMTTYRLRKQMYAILQAYLKELSRYEFSEKTVRHMAAFCCNLYSKDREYKEDLEDVLFECHNSAARQVMQLLKNI